MSLQNNLSIRPASTTALYRHPYHSQQSVQQQHQHYYARPPSIQPYQYHSQSQQQVIGHGSSRNQTSTNAYKNYNEPHSHVLELILNSDEPIPTQELTHVNVNGYQGVQLNRQEETEWRGGLPLDRYPINQDPNPEIIRKKASKPIKYQQKVAVRYLNPPPIKPGDLVIRERQTSLPPAPPLLVRQYQHNTQLRTPSPIVLREAPPRPPSVFESKVVRIQNKLPPLPRRLIVEKLPEAPQKPAPIIIEKWLPYKPRKVKVIFQRAAAPTAPTDLSSGCCSQQTQQK